MSRSLCEWCVSPRVFCCCVQDQLWCPQPVYHSRSVPAWSQTVWQCTPAKNGKIRNSFHSYTHTCKRWGGQTTSVLDSITYIEQSMKKTSNNLLCLPTDVYFICYECFFLRASDLSPAPPRCILTRVSHARVNISQACDLEELKTKQWVCGQLYPA